MSGSTCLIIAGAGGLGREIAVYAAEAGYRVRGFLDDTDADPSRFGLDIPVLGNIDSYQPQPHDAVLAAIGDPHLRKEVVERLKRRGAAFGLLIHPLAYVAAPSRIAEGCVVAPFATIGLNAVLDAHCLINTHAGIGHDAQIGACSAVSPHAAVNGSARLAAAVFVGSAAVIGPGCAIGEGAKISAGTTVLSDVAAGAVMWGNPARALPPAPATPKQEQV